MLSPDYKEFENILAKVFEVEKKYVKNPSVNTSRLDLMGIGYGGTFYFDIPKKELIEKPQYYHLCRIELKSKDEAGKKWKVNIIDHDSDVDYEFTEDSTGKIGDGIEVSREDISYPK